MFDTTNLQASGDAPTDAQAEGPPADGCPPTLSPDVTALLPALDAVADQFIAVTAAPQRLTDEELLLVLDAGMRFMRRVSAASDVLAARLRSAQRGAAA